MGYPLPPRRPKVPGETDEQYRAYLLEYRAWLIRASRRYEHEMTPWILVGTCTAIVVAFGIVLLAEVLAR